MSEQELECQNHANCGDYCNTPREREMVLCEGCLDSYDQQQADQEELHTLRAEAEALRAENGPKQQTIDGMNAEHWELVQAHAVQAKELEAARELLRELIGAVRTINHGPQHKIMVKGDDHPSYWQRQEWVVYLLNMCNEAEASLTSTPAPEVQAEQAQCDRDLELFGVSFSVRALVRAGQQMANSCYNLSQFEIIGDTDLKSQLRDLARGWDEALAAHRQAQRDD